MSDPGEPIGDAATTEARPALRLVRGDAAPEELAALVAVLAARGADDAGPVAPRPQCGRWGDPATGLRGRLDPGPGAWRASAR